MVSEREGECYREAGADALMDFLAQGMLGITKVSLEGGTLFESESREKESQLLLPSLLVGVGCLCEIGKCLRTCDGPSERVGALGCGGGCCHRGLVARDTVNKSHHVYCESDSELCVDWGGGLLI